MYVCCMRERKKEKYEIKYLIIYTFICTGRITDEEDEDYDSELEDFIDDEVEDENEDYSKYISEIFGYDKNKYKHVDNDDDTAMESSFAQQLKEEYVSTKIGNIHLL